VEVFKKKIIGQLCIHYFPQITSVICVVLLGKQAQDNAANKTDCHDITEILLKVALNTINQTK
jgi:hypothetical protein